MKKIITIFTAMAVALTFGVAFAQEQKMETPEKKEEMAPMKKEMKKETKQKKAAKKKKMKKEEMKKEEMKKEEAAPMAPAGK